MIGLVSAAVCLVLFLGSLIFAGTKGREAAKRKWTICVVLLFVAFCLSLILMLKIDPRSSDTAVLVVSGLLLLGGAAGYIFNSLGKWLIDFVAFNVMSDNRERVVKGYDKPWSDL